VLLVTLNRPEVRNAFNTRMGEELLELWTRLTAEAGEVRCVVITGAGDQAFCAGAGLKAQGHADAGLACLHSCSSAPSGRWAICHRR
jgi:enoyl-CoA hydratase/carnithine racemase